MSTTLATDEPERPEPTRGTTWRRLLFWSLLGIPILFIVLIPFIGFSAFILIFIIVPSIAAFWVRAGGRGAVIFALVVAALIVFMNVPFFVVPALTQPASTGDFISAVIFTCLAVLALIASIAILRRGDGPSPVIRTAIRVALGAVLLSVLIAIVARVTYEAATPEQGDVRVVTEGIEFVPEELEAASGADSVFVDNNDQTLHTFTIDELDVSLQIPASGSERIDFDAPAGEYEFYCIPHESTMKGTLTVR